MSVLVVAQSSSEISEGLMNNPVLVRQFVVLICLHGSHNDVRIEISLMNITVIFKTFLSAI